MARVDVRLIGTGSSRGTALTSRPNDGSGYWPDDSNTGYLREPSYPGSVADWTGGMSQDGNCFVQVADDTVISYKRMLGKSYIGYQSVGDRLTFVGCVFEGTLPNDNMVQIYCATTVTFRYCTFKPNQYSAPPGNDGSMSSSRTAPGTPYSQSWQLIANEVEGTVVEFDHCDIWGGAGLEGTGGTDASHPARFTNCYIHDCSDTDSSGAPPGQNYHHDGIGPDSEGGGHDTIVDHCTIASLGNTNGVALQGDSTYNRVSITNCYVSGWGYSLCVGARDPWQGTNITVTGNIFSAELDCIFGPWFNNVWNDGDGTNAWAGNRFQVRAGDDFAALSTSDHGKYWWPDDNDGHLTDYTG
jgi:hypothetical protein